MSGLFIHVKKIIDHRWFEDISLAKHYFIKQRHKRVFHFFSYYVTNCIETLILVNNEKEKKSSSVLRTSPPERIIIFTFSLRLPLE